MKIVRTKTGIIFNPFEVLHTGHLRMLEEAKMHCDYLIVALQTNPLINMPEKNKSTQSVVERYIQLKACRFVDEIIPYTTEQDVEYILHVFPIDVWVLEDANKNINFRVREYCEKMKIQLISYIPNHHFSGRGSTDISLKLV